jgi:hypothetical protein
MTQRVHDERKDLKDRSGPSGTRTLAAIAIAALLRAVVVGATFDHAYGLYAKVIRDHVRMPSVDYAALKNGRQALDAAVDAFAQASEAEERGWTREQRLAFWINAYNAFTLRAIVDHYPIRGPWLTLQPRNSIRQISGVWTTIRWRAAGRELTLDDIEHQILRRELKDPRIHFAINCASVSCPPLPPEPYRAETLDAQLDEAARRYLASPEGMRIDGNTLRVSSILRWYGEDFVERFASIAPEGRDEKERAVRGVIIRFGPPEAAALAGKASTPIRFLSYDWSLNDATEERKDR